MDKDKYSLATLIEIRFGDPVTALSISDSFVLIGSMMGRITICNIFDGKTTVIADINSENITSVSYNEYEERFNVAIGDEIIERFHFTHGKHGLSYTSTTIKNYTSDYEHGKKCENAFVLLSPDYYFRVQLQQPQEGNLTINAIDAEYEIKEITTDKGTVGNLGMTNYSVPMDFNGTQFVWVEYLSSTDRNICVASLTGSKEVIKKKIDKSFGHISHLKLIQNNKLILVRSLNVCEIRQIDQNLTLLKSFKHIGDEVYAVDVVYHKKENTYQENYDKDFESDVNPKKINNKNKMDENLCIKVGLVKQREESMDKKYEASNSLNKDLITSNNNFITSIVTLDIDGNVNIYSEEKEYTLFNLYDISEISQDHKDKQFFSMGYAYYIKTNMRYFCISSDHGCYVITKK